MRAAAVAVLIVLGLVTGGCGGSDKPDPPAAAKAKPSLTRGQFIARANSLCRGARARVARVVKPTDLVSYARASRSLLNIATGLRDDISDLDPPAADRGIVDAYLAAMEAPIRELRRIRTAAYKEDHDEVVRLAARYSTASRRADRLADGFGMTTCGTGA